MAIKSYELPKVDILNGGGVTNFLVNRGMETAQLPASLLPQILTADKLLMPDGVTSINRRLQQISGTNLLINSVWTDERAIVNQRNQKEYTNNSYTIDGWFIGTDGGSVSLQDGKLHFKRDGSWMNFIQNIEKFDSMKGERLTLSVLADGRFGLVVQYKNDGYLFSDIVEREHGVHSFTFDLPTDATMFSVMLSIPDNNGQNFYAAKLEPGPFQTLAHQEGSKWVLNDPPPNYALELLKCQRYQCVFKFSAYAFFSLGIAISSSELIFYMYLPNSLRSRPTCTAEHIVVLNASKADQPSNAKEISIKDLHIAQNVVRLYVTTKNTGDALVPGDIYQLISTNVNGKLLFDSNL